MQKIKITFFKIGLAFASFIVSFVFLELILSFMASIDVIPDYRGLAASATTSVQDEILAYKLPPHIYGDIDGNGFRNKFVPPKADVIVLGDSQTYGYNASTENSWPAQLSRLAGLSVYNMGIGGYGPAQYYYLLKEGLKLNPEFVLVGSYFFGNDLPEVCSMLVNFPYWINFAAQNNLDTKDCLEVKDEKLNSQNELTFFGSIIYRLRRTHVASFLRQVGPIRDFFSYRRDRALARQNPNNFLLVDEPEIKTILYISPGLSTLDSPIVKNGIELSKFFYGKIKEESSGRKVIVVFIPTRDNVLHDFLVSRGYKLPNYYTDFVFAEREAIKEFGAYLDGLGVESVDAAPFMKKKIKAGEPLFLNFLDRHPTVAGYEGIAEAAASVFSPH